MAAKESSLAAKGVHLINYDGELMSTNEIQDFLITAVGGSQGGEALRRTGVNYHVVGVFGGQSSGKSTLLNSLFSTQFQTMNEAQRRGQTTKGAFIARAKYDVCQMNEKDHTDAAMQVENDVDVSSPLFVLDFEGTDGIERGENQSFERQLSLFALSVADTLIINMWAVDVGRFNAANMSLLRTIFEVNLQLFSHDSYEREEKPTLLIVLRDFIGDDAKYYFETVRSSFDKIWESIVKPDAFKDSSIDVFFDLCYHVLPHYKLQRADFDEAIVAFREWFFLPSSSNNLFRNRGMLRGVPLEGIPAYISSCWEMICSSKDLDIPTQREMLAKHRCIEAKRDATNMFKEYCREYADRLQSGDLVPRLTNMLERKVEELLAEFNTQTKLYKANIVRETAAELKEGLFEEELKLLRQYAKTIGSAVVAELDATVSSAVDRTLNWMLQKALSLPLLGTEADDEGRRSLDFHRQGNHLKGDSKDTNKKDAALADSEMCNELVRDFWKKLSIALQADVEVLYCDDESQRQRLLSHLYGSYASYVAEDAALQEAVGHAVFDAVHQKVRHRFASMAENAAETIHQAFERSLTCREDGTVHFFKTRKGLQSVELKARQAGLVFLGCLLYYRLKIDVIGTEEDVVEKAGVWSQAAALLIRERRMIDVRDNSAEQKFFFYYTSIFEVPRYPTGIPMGTTTGSDDVSGDILDGDSVLLSPQAVQRAFDVYTQKCGFTIQLQLRSIESGSQKLPAWVLPALFVLGWNEMWYILKSPLLLLLVVTVAALFFRHFLVSQWEAFEETGPTWLVVMIRTVLQKVWGLLEKVMPPSLENGDRNRSQYRDPRNFLDITSASVSS